MNLSLIRAICITTFSLLFSCTSTKKDVIRIGVLNKPHSLQSWKIRDGVSNVITNSLEALRGRPGTVTLNLKESGTKELHLSVKDDGIGITNEHIKLVGTKGFTAGKDEGNGLGLHSAITTLQKWGGSLKITSEAGLGTEVSITIPRVAPPRWFAQQITFPIKGFIVVVDNDRYIHTLWMDRFQCLDRKSNVLQFRYLASAEELRSFMKDEYLDSLATLFLIDQDLSAERQTGLELISHFGIAAESVLVTNRFADPTLQIASIDIQLKILPKPLICTIPVRSYVL